MQRQTGAEPSQHSIAIASGLDINGVCGLNGLSQFDLERRVEIVVSGEVIGEKIGMLDKPERGDPV
jgi:hypothetical protein